MITKINDRIAGQNHDDALSATYSFSVPNDLENLGAKNQPRPDREISFQSSIMNRYFELAKTYARSSAAVVVVGESGTGKELFSRLIHTQSNRQQQQFVAVNCAALAESLIESELFGHEKGAFTGADSARIGHFERASGGTLLLDEVTEIPLAMQAKLLRVLEEQEVLPVGARRSRPIDVRIIATSNRDLKEEVESSRFRIDLYHRLNVLELDLPPLRKRVADVPLLAMHFVQKFQAESMHGPLSVTSDAMKLLCNFHWPGNVRQLRNVIHRACVVCSSNVIDVDALPTWLAEQKADAESKSFFGMTLADTERCMILTALEKFKGNKRLAANELGVTARTLTNKLRIYRELGFDEIRPAKNVG